uniref:hypothetical protein 58 n=1 Tax=Moniliophthora perniciosa TaxID=153609 RepID=UPI0000242373|nr:hypothetical protein 58 [Moniliophthora perniciosa]AAQ74328.1 hypothetical protein 58 [Moniliophthora perniciosa]
MIFFFYLKMFKLFILSPLRNCLKSFKAYFSEKTKFSISNITFGLTLTLFTILVLVSFRSVIPIIHHISSELFIYTRSVIKFKIYFFSFSFSILTLFKLILYLIIFSLVTYILYIELYLGKRIKYYETEVTENITMLQSGFFSLSTSNTLKRVLALTLGSATLIGGFSAIKNELITHSNIPKLLNELLEKVNTLDNKVTQLESENNSLTIAAQNGRTSNIAFSDSILSVTNENKKTITSTMQNSAEIKKLITLAFNERDPEKQKAYLTEIFSKLSLIDAKQLELLRSHGKLASHAEEFHAKFKELKSEESKISESQNQNSDSKSNPTSDSSNPPILSPLESDLFFKLSTLKELSIGFLIMNSVILSCIVNIVFTYFGEYLIHKFSLEVRYPKLSKIIALRRQFQGYYLKINITIIIIDVLIQMLVLLSILSL